MGKKSLGRGLDEISDIFLSTRKDRDLRNGFASTKIRDTTCESCSNIIHDSNNASKCKIFTLQNKKYGVRFMDTISPGSGSYCEYFEQRFQKNSDIGFMAKETPSDNTAASCDIEESIIVRRSIEYPNTPKAQQDILKSLSKHLEENYSVRRIELEKTDRISQPGMKKYTEEIVTITIHGGADNGSYS